MKSIILSLILSIFSLSIAWGGDPEPTAISNKEAIDLVQTHANYLWTLVAAALVLFKLIDATVGLRVSPEEEMEGLDVTEHSGAAYPNFASYGGMGGFDATVPIAKPSALGAAAEPIEQT